MEFISGVENATRKIRTTICAWTPISLHPPRLRSRHIDTQANPSRMRLQVLRRDRYRCRSCNRVGDEITLEVLPIWPRASTIEEMLTLCVHCKKLFEQWNIKPSIDLGLLNNYAPAFSWMDIGKTSVPSKGEETGHQPSRSGH